jgi:beta-lactamase regulating signal transducer with metallopeptidase domain
MSDVAVALRVAGSQLEALGHALADRAVALNFWTALLLGGAMALDRALARRARASWRLALYAPVGLRVLLPVDWRLPIAHAPHVGTLFAPLAHIAGRAPEQAATWPSPSWHAALAVVYVVVAAFLAGRTLFARVRLVRALEAAPPVLGRALAGAEPVLGPHPGVPCPVLQHEALGPMVVGLVAPRIVVPRRLLVAGEEHTLACVLRHEVAHLRRRDAWLAAAMQALSIVAWPVLPLWLACARVRQLVELACDEAALHGADATERSRYGHALLDLAEWDLREHTPLGAGALHFGSTLRARIEALGSQRHWPLALQAITLGVLPLALLAACGATAPPSASATPAPARAGEGYGYEFETDPAKAAAATTAPPSPPPGPDGRIPPETIQTAVRARFGVLLNCYEAGLAANPKLAGTVTVKFVFGEDGVTREASDDHSTLPDPRVVACVVDELRKVKYPSATKPTGVVTVVYPILFTP